MRLEQRTEARALTAEVLKQSPHLTLGSWPMFAVYRQRQDADHMIEALREAGFPW